MTRRVFLHIGLPKSGTTYVQTVLAENKERLAERANLLYPGRTWEAQVKAVRDLRSKNVGGAVGGSRGAWQRLVDEISAWDGDSVVSMEWLAGATTQDVRRTFASFPHQQVNVIISMRDLARTIPAAWQEFVQNRETWTWSEFIRAVSSDAPRATPAGDRFWSQQDIGKILTVWRDAIPAERIHVVTLPQPGAPAGELWSRFASVLEIDGLLFDASGKGSNESLGRESAELMVRVSETSRLRGIDRKTYEEMLKQATAKRGLSKRRHVERPQHRLPHDLEEWARVRSAQHIEVIKAAGVDVVGDLSELEPTFSEDRLGDDGVDAEAVLEAAVEGLVALAMDRGKELERLRRRAAKLERENRQLSEHTTASGRQRVHRCYRSLVNRLHRFRGHPDDVHEASPVHDRDGRR